MTHPEQACQPKDDDVCFVLLDTFSGLQVGRLYQQANRERAPLADRMELQCGHDRITVQIIPVQH